MPVPTDSPSQPTQYTPLGSVGRIISSVQSLAACVAMRSLPVTVVPYEVPAPEAQVLRR